MAKAKTAKIENPNKKQLSIVSGNGATEVERKQNQLVQADVEAEIRRRAYELYERRGRTPGHESEDWLIAEQEIAGRHQHQGA